MIHNLIGSKTRLKKIWILDLKEIERHFETETAQEIANSIGCTYKTITRILKQNEKYKYDLRTTRKSKIHRSAG